MRRRRQVRSFVIVVRQLHIKLNGIKKRSRTDRRTDGQIFGWEDGERRNCKANACRMGREVERQAVIGGVVAKRSGM